MSQQKKRKRLSFREEYEIFKAINPSPCHLAQRNPGPSSRMFTFGLIFSRRVLLVKFTSGPKSSSRVRLVKVREGVK